MIKGKKTGTAAADVTKEMLVTNRLGIHARPAAMFVKLASQFDAEIMVQKDDEVVNGKSIMGLLMLAAGCGSHLQVHAKGEDANKALTDLEGLLRRKFDEE
jgi:phosphocarrier protein